MRVDFSNPARRAWNKAHPFLFWEFWLADIWTMYLGAGYRFVAESKLKRTDDVNIFGKNYKNGSYIETIDSKQHGINASGIFLVLSIRSYY